MVVGTGGSPWPIVTETKNGFLRRFNARQNVFRVTHLKDDRLIIFLEVKSKHVSIFECVSA